MPTRESQIYVGCGLIVLAAAMVSLKLSIFLIGAMLVIDAASGN